MPTVSETKMKKAVEVPITFLAWASFRAPIA